MRIGRIPLVLLTALVAACLVAPSSVYAASKADVAAHAAAAAAARKKAAAEQAKADALLSESQQMEKKIDALEAELDVLGAQIGTASERRANLDAQVELLRAQVSAKEAEIIDLRSQLDERSAALAARVDVFYRTGDWAYIEMLLGSENLADFIRRTEFVTMLIRDDEEAANELDNNRIALEQANIELGRVVEAVQTKRTEAHAEEMGLKTLQSSRDSKRAAQQAVQDQKNAMLALTKKNVARLRALALAEERESARIASLLKGGGYSVGSGKYAGTFRWPAPGNTRVSSSFGYRTHPILRVRKMHNGIDVSAPSGAKLVAVGNGKVIYAGRNGGYGNFTMIDHGDGLVSCYAHQSKIAVSKGQTVSAGSTIGYVGSTGLSTGPHLHFEVRVNGTPINPLDYL